MGVPAFFWCDLRPVFANVLADLKLAQLRDQPGPQRQTKKQRRQRGKRSAKGRVLEHAKRREVAEQLFVEQPIEHLIGPREEPLQGVLDMDCRASL